MGIFILTMPGAPGDPMSYMLWPTVLAPSCGTPKKHICYIITADYSNGYPIIDGFILGQMVTALNTNTDNLFVGLKP